MINKDKNWKQITNHYKSTCCVCNRSIDIDDVILWNKEEKLVCHLPEMCAFLGIRKKRESTRAKKTNSRAKGTNPKNKAKEIITKRQAESIALTKRINQYNFPVEVRKIG
jgi:hypothetical protein